MGERGYGGRSDDNYGQGGYARGDGRGGHSRSYSSHGSGHRYTTRRRDSGDMGRGGSVPGGSWRAAPRPVVLPSMRSTTSSESSSSGGSPAISAETKDILPDASITIASLPSTSNIVRVDRVATFSSQDSHDGSVVHRSWADEEDDFIDYEKDPFEQADHPERFPDQPSETTTLAISEPNIDNERPTVQSSGGNSVDRTTSPPVTASGSPLSPERRAQLREVAKMANQQYTDRKQQMDGPHLEQHSPRQNSQPNIEDSFRKLRVYDDIVTSGAPSGEHDWTQDPAFVTEHGLSATAIAPVNDPNPPKRSHLDAAMESYFGKEAVERSLGGNWRDRSTFAPQGSSYGTYRSESAFSSQHRYPSAEHHTPASTHNAESTSSPSAAFNRQPSHTSSSYYQRAPPINYERKVIKFKLAHGDPQETITVKLRRMNIQQLQY